MSEDCTSEPDRTPGLISWNEIGSHDPAGTTSFYTSLFGWTIQEVEMPDGGVYTMYCAETSAGPRPVAGMYPMPDGLEAPTHWIGYVTVEKLEDAVKKTEELGGKICKEIMDIPMGRFAIVMDPQGAVIGLWQFK